MDELDPVIHAQARLRIMATLTYLALSKKGRRAFEDYMDTLRTVLGEQP